MDGPGMALFAARVRCSSCLTALQVTLVRTCKTGSAEEWRIHLTRPQRHCEEGLPPLVSGQQPGTLITHTRKRGRGELGGEGKGLKIAPEAF